MRRVRLCTLAFACAFVPINAAVAAEEESSSGVMEEITVTATYRDTNLMDTPVAVSALTDSMIEDLGAQSIGDIFQMVPGLNMTSTDEGANRFTVRGVTSQTGGTGYFLVGATVGVYLDGTPVTAALGPDNQVSGALFDIERVEVLKGPQGTLFGEGSQGGTIRYLYKKPDITRFDSAVNVGMSSIAHSDETSRRIDAMVNIPMGERLALRLTIFDSDTAGWLDNTAPVEPDFNTASLRGGRAVLAYEGDRFTLTASAYHQEQETEGGTETVSAYIVSKARLPGLPPYSLDETDIYSFKAEIDFGWAALTSFTSLTDRRIRGVSESNPEGIQGLDNFYGRFFALVDPLVIADGNNLVAFDGFTASWTDRFVQEFRLVSTGDGRLRWILGAFMKDSDDRSGNTQAGGYTPGREAFRDRFELLLQAPANNHTDTLEELAVFGEVTYDITDKLEATVGLRVSKLDQFFENTQSSTNDSPISPKFVLSWRPREDLLTYFSWATGFRPGNVNNHMEFAVRQLEILVADALARPACDPAVDATCGAAFDPVSAAAAIQGESDRARDLRFFDGDEVDSYELGVKTTMLDGRLRLMGSLYYFDWQDMIMLERDTSYAATGFNFYNINAGGATTQGIELEIGLALTERLSIRLAGDWNDTELTKKGSDRAVALSATSGGSVGNELIYAPNYSASLSVDYEFAPFRGWKIILHADRARVAEQFTNSENSLVIPSYEKTNARITARSPDERLRIALAINNLTDEEILRNRTSGTFFWDRPRTIGLEVGWHM